jgi:RNA polymerase sigma-70 factor (ECF subfamily)
MQALTTILPNLERFVRALVRRRGAATESTETARDLLSETIAEAYQRFNSVRSPEALLSFCFTIATRLNGREQQQSRRFTVFDSATHERLGYTHANSDNADVGLLYAALDTLPDKQREAIIMFEILGFSMKEIHEVQGGTLIAVKVRISRGRSELTRLLTERQPAYILDREPEQTTSKKNSVTPSGSDTNYATQRQFPQQQFSPAIL